MVRTGRLDSPRFTFSDYRGWSGDERWELLGGEAVAMTPAPSRLHQAVLVALAGQIEPILRGHRCAVYLAPFDVRLPVSGEPDDEVATVVQPDLSVICDPDKLDDLGCRGAPDWVVEVVSPSTAARDRVQKRDLYEHHGVREYWIVDPEARSLTIYRRVEGSFAPPVRGSAKGRVAVEAVPELAVDWDLALS